MRCNNNIVSKNGRTLRSRKSSRENNVNNNIKSTPKKYEAAKEKSVITRSKSSAVTKKRTENGKSVLSRGTSRNRPDRKNHKNNDSKLKCNNNKSLLIKRKRKSVNYAESSLESTPKITTKTIVNRVPVYKQEVNVKMTSKKEDLYEFDSDSEKYKKRKKHNLNDSSFVEYGKTKQKIVKNATKKNKKILISDKNVKKVEGEKEILKRNGITKDAVIVLHELNNIDKNIHSEKVNSSTIPSKKTIEDIRTTNCNEGEINNRVEFDKSTNVKEDGSKIKIISNIQLQPNQQLNLSVTTPIRKPNANSTMINNVLTPWRFNDINIKRNPHFITLKESALPCINQEMVLDHTIVDKFANTSRANFTNTSQLVPKQKSPQKTIIQKTLTDYFGNNNENKENSQLSLFDEDLLSPIKNKNRFASKIDMVKRRILGDKDDNIISNQIHISTPKHSYRSETPLPITQETEESKNFTNFGFTSDEEEEEDDSRSSKTNKENKPFRLSINVNDKKYESKRKMKRVKIDPLADLNHEDSAESDTESHCDEVKLFEDLHDINDDSLQEPKVKKRKRTKWLNDDNLDVHKHKKRKDVRTKEEEAEAEKWAAAFNSMCEEIEDFPLEIE